MPINRRISVVGRYNVEEHLEQENLKSETVRVKFLRGPLPINKSLNDSELLQLGHDRIRRLLLLQMTRGQTVILIP
jgi:hypothetical protein